MILRKLTPEMIEKIKAAPGSTRSLAKVFSISPFLIWAVKKGRYDGVKFETKSSLKKVPMRFTGHGARFTNEQIEFIRTNAPQMTIRQLCNAVGCSDTTMNHFLKYNKIEFIRMRGKSYLWSGPSVKKKTVVAQRSIPNYREDQKKSFTRPPAIYDNESREQAIERILSMAI